MASSLSSTKASDAQRAAKAPTDDESDGGGPQQSLICEPPQGPLHIDDPALQGVIARFPGPHKAWQKRDVVRVAVPVLRNRMCFWLRGASPESCAAWSVFFPKWEDYLAEHADVMALIDPFYVHFAIPPGGAPVGFAAAVVADVREAAAAVLLPGGGASATLFQVASLEWAYHLAGRLAQLFPTVEIAYFRSAGVVVF
jgi:hypothetical protein